MIHLIKKVISQAADKVAERISDRDLVKRIADMVPIAEVAEHFDTEEIAGHVDLYDIASNIEMDELARNIDLNELADRVVDLLPERPAASPAPEPEIPVSDPSLIERLLEKAVDKLLLRAEEAARNGEV